MGLILDLAVVALALVVIGSLGLLAWTLGVSAVRSVRRERASVAAARRTVAEAEGRLVSATARIGPAVEGLARRTESTTTASRPMQPTTPSPGEQPDA